MLISSSYLSNLPLDQQLVPAVLLLSHQAVAAAWAAAIGGADTLHPVVTLAARTAHSSCRGLLGAGCRTKAPPQWGTPPTVSVYCKHATAEVTGKGFFCGGTAAFVAVAADGQQKVVESLVGGNYSQHSIKLHQQMDTFDFCLLWLFLVHQALPGAVCKGGGFSRRSYIKACLVFNQRQP